MELEFFNKLMIMGKWQNLSNGAVAAQIDKRVEDKNKTKNKYKDK